MAKRGVQRAHKKKQPAKKTKPVAVPSGGAAWAREELAKCETGLEKAYAFYDQQLEKAIEAEDVAKVAKLRAEIERRQTRALQILAQEEAAELPQGSNVASRAARRRYSLAPSDLEAQAAGEADTGAAEGG